MTLNESVKSVLRNKYYERRRSFIESMKCFKIYDLAVTLTNYFSKNKKLKIK